MNIRTPRALQAILPILAIGAGIHLTVTAAQSQPVPQTTPGSGRTASPHRTTTYRESPSRKAAEQRALSIDAGDSYIPATGTRRMLRRMPGTIAIPSARAGDPAVARLTRPGGPLSGYTEQQWFRTGFSLLTGPSQQASRERREPGANAAAVRLSRAAWTAGAVNPVFIDPETGLRLLATTRLIVRLRPGTDPSRHFGAQWRDVEPLGGASDQFLLNLPGGTAEAVFAEVNRQSAQADVEWAEPDFICQALRLSTPNDPLFADQWHLNNTGQGNGSPGADAHLPDAWTLATGSSNIVIAIIDDGVERSHPDLMANIFTNTGEIAGNGFDDDQNGLIDDRQGYNFVADLPNPDPYSEDDNHGTAVAGVAAAAGNNGLGVTGAAQGCRILPIKVLEGDSAASTSAFAKAIRYAAGLNGSGNTVWRGADVINISLAFPQNLVTDAALADATSKGRNGRGCAVFVAAGNSASAWEPVLYDVTEAGTYTLIFEYRKDSSGSLGADTAWIDSIRYPDGSLETFEGGIPNGWVTSPSSPWRVVTNGVGDNFALTGWNGPNSRALRAGTISHGQMNFVEYTTVLTPGTLIAWSLVSTEYDYDFFDVWIGRNGTDTRIFSQSGVAGTQPAVGYPANNLNTIAVGASTDFDFRSDYSQYGPALDFVAPSDGGALSILTTDRSGALGYNNGDYTYEFGGTSSATPLAAGVAALVLSINPHITASELRTLLRATCDHIGDVTYDTAGRNSFYGSGRVNAARAVSQARPNLRVTLATSAGPIIAGDLSTYTIDVRNNGTSRSGTVTVTNLVPPGTTFVSATPSPSSQSNGRLTFIGSSVLPGATWSITVTVSNRLAGTNTLIAGAYNDVSETSTTDNAASGAVAVLPIPVISIGNVAIAEGAAGKTNALLPVTMSNPSSRRITVSAITVTNTASAGTDFTPVKLALTFLPGQTQQVVSVPIVGDLRNEADESLLVRLENPSNAVLGADTGTVTILNDDGLPVISAPAVVRKEGNAGAGKAIFRFRLSAPSGRAVTVEYATLEGSARAGTDFIPTNGVLTFLPGKTTATATILVSGDRVLETNEVFFVSLLNPVNAELATNRVACTILDNDPPPKASIDDLSVLEGGTTNRVSVSVRLATASELPVQLGFMTTNGTALAGVDYIATNGVVTFAPGETNASIDVDVIGDSVIEPLEYFSVRIWNLTNAILAKGIARVTLTNDDVVQMFGAGVQAVSGAASVPVRLQGEIARDTLSGASVFLVRFTARTGARYVLESTDNPGEPSSWRPVPGIDVVGAGTEIVLSLPADRHATWRFFRVKQAGRED